MISLTQKWLNLLGLFVLSTTAIANIRTSEMTADLRWAEVNGAIQYEWQLALNDNFESIHLTGFSTDPFVEIALRPGYYYFRVRGINNRNKFGFWSEVQLVEIVPPPVPIAYGSPFDPGVSEKLKKSKKTDYDSLYPGSSSATAIRLSGLIGRDTESGDTISAELGWYPSLRVYKGMGAFFFGSISPYKVKDPEATIWVIQVGAGLFQRFNNIGIEGYAGFQSWLDYGSYFTVGANLTYHLSQMKLIDRIFLGMSSHSLPDHTQYGFRIGLGVRF